MVITLQTEKKTTQVQLPHPSWETTHNWYIILQRFELKAPKLVQFFDFVKNPTIVEREIINAQGLNKFSSV